MATTSETASPIGIANLYRHKIVAKRGAAFTIMVAGESGLGKTTFINTLFSTTIKNYADHKRRHQKQIDRTVEIEITKAELEEKFFKVRLTVIDTPGFGDYVNNRDSWQPIIEFLDDQHESYMLQEQQPRRTDKIDMRVHACLYFIRPTGHTLKPLDIEVMKRLSSRVNLIPVIAKADTLSPTDLARFKQRVKAVVEAQGIKIYTPPIEEDDEHAAAHARSLMAAMPFAVIGSEKDVKTNDNRVVKGRQYAWGVAEVENEDHCDFKKLRSILIRTHMLDLIHTTEEQHYEAYRAQQMETRKFGEARPRKLDNPKFKEEEEALRKRFTEQVKVEEQRFRQWEQKLISERDRLNKDLEATHAAYEALSGGALFKHERVGSSGNNSLSAILTSKGENLPINACNKTISHEACPYSQNAQCYPGTYVLTGSSDRAIHLSRAIPNSSTTGHETTSPIQKYEAHGYSVLDVAVAADNARFTSVGGDRQVFLWDVEQGITTRRWAGHNARVEAVQFAGEGDSVVVSGSADTTINLWDTRSKSHKPIQTLTEAGDTVSSLHVHMPTYSIASGSYDGRARIYDVRMGRTTVDVLAHPVTSVRCSADGNALLVSTLDSRIRMLDRADGKLLKAFGGEEGLEQSTTGARVTYRNSELRIRSVFAKGDAVVLSGSESEKGDPSPQAHVFAWDVLSGEVIATVRAGNGVKVVSCVAWNEKGGCWAGGCSDGTVKIYG
ncbi:Septin-domain-containing protein [Aspergillus fumigatus]